MTKDGIDSYRPVCEYGSYQHVHNLNATMSHPLGLDHERLTYRYQGRAFRLTDVHGKVINEIVS